MDEVDLRGHLRGRHILCDISCQRRCVCLETLAGVTSSPGTSSCGLTRPNTAPISADRVCTHLCGDC
jgi:hypothetical protein